MAAFAEGIFRSIMFFFDQIIYSFIPVVYDFIMVLAGVTVFDEVSIQRIADNIYGIIGLFVVFRIAFILINSIVNPDKLTDKQAGFAKLISKVLVALLLIVAIPYGFELGYRLQKEILSSQVLERIILGGMDVKNSSYGSNMSYLSLRSFLTCKMEENDSACVDLETGFSEAFYPDYGEPSFTYLSDILNTKVQIDRNDTFAYDYKAGLSTICGAVILFMLITLCFDVAVRVIKLGFLQLVSPIAVIGYIEPTKDIFKTWLKMTLVTYFNLFVRIISIAFVAYVMSSISFNLVDLEGNALDPGTQLFAQIFLILGLLIFAKEAPKMIMNILGLKEEGLGSINPLSKLGSVPFVGGAAAAGIGMGVAGATGLAMKGMAASGGAVRGGFNSWKHGGGIRAGALKGAGAAAQNVSLGGGLKGINKQFTGMLASGRKAADAGATSAAGVETKTGFLRDLGSRTEASIEAAQQRKRSAQAMQQGKSLRDQINNNPRYSPAAISAITDERQKARLKAEATSSIFQNKEFGALYRDHYTAKGLQKIEQRELRKMQDDFALMMSQYEQPGSTISEGAIRDEQIRIAEKEREVRKYESAVKTLESAYSEASKLASNKADVDNLAALSTYDDISDARSNL